jgi:altered-inheritance-of-mitochondria protein 13
MQTDTTRAQTLELHIQARVADELKRLQSRQDAALKEAQEKLSQTPIPEDEKASSKLSSQSVNKEVDTLRARLEQRKKVRDVPTEVERARSDVVRCLREHDRRPLDCWQEVETFKKEVRRMEEEWVKKVMQ